MCVLWVFFSSWLCCPLRFQNSPQTHRWEGFLVFGNLSSLNTPSPGQVSIPNSFVCLFISFIFCPTSFPRQWAAFLGACCPLPAIRSCFVVFAQRSNDLLMNLLGRKWSPHPIPPLSLDCPLEFYYEHSRTIFSWEPIPVTYQHFLEKSTCPCILLPQIETKQIISYWRGRKLIWSMDLVSVSS